MRSTTPMTRAAPQNGTVHQIREGRSAHIHDNVDERTSATRHKVLERLVDYRESGTQQKRKQRVLSQRTDHQDQECQCGYEEMAELDLQHHRLR